MERVQLIATTIFGLESVVKKELADMGFARFSVSDGRVEFPGVLGDVPRLNIRLRAADRVLIKVAEFPAADFDALFDQTHALPWDRWIPEDAKITVTGKSARSVLKSVRSNQSMVKKAILKRMKARFKRDWFPETGPEFIIQISLFKDRAQLTLDTSGAGLHRRGYRVDTGEVPIRENLAAGLNLLSPWDQKTPLLDPMCGSGTLLIEAAMIARNIAPGLRRNFLSEAWPMMDQRAWSEARLAAAGAVIPSGEVRIFGYDIDQKRIAGCQQNAKNAGVDKDIIFRQQDVKDLRLEQDRGQVISNPPYGVKMAGPRELYHLYAALNAVFEDRPGWALNIITSDKKFPQHFKRARPDKIRKLYNGTIEVHFYQYRGKTVGL